MTQGWLALEIGVNIYQAILFFILHRHGLHIVRKSRALDAACIAIYAMFLTSYLFWDVPVYDSVGCVIFMLYALIASDDPWYYCAFWVLTSEVIIVASTCLLIMLHGVMFSVPHEVLLEHNMYRLNMLLSSQIAMGVETYLITRGRWKSSALSKPALLFLLGLSALLLVSLELVYTMFANSGYAISWVFFMAYAVMLAIALCPIMLFRMISGSEKRERDARLELQQAKLTRQHQQALQDMYSDMLTRSHDFKHQMQTVEMLIEQGGSEAARDYFDEYKRSAGRQTRYLTGSLAVDALLTAKSIFCANHGIAFELNQCPLSDLPISEVDFCTIVGNLMDNAIEGSTRMGEADGEKWIRLSFSRVWDMFVIRCENSMKSETIQRRQGLLRSSKEDAAAHGLGIPSIIQIAESAEGFCSFEPGENAFAATVTLPYPVRNGAQGMNGAQE